MRGSFICLAVLGLIVAGAPSTLAEEANSKAPEALIGKSVHDLARGAIGAAVKDDIKALRSGPLLMHGNFCGIGNKPGKAPIDDLDAACMRHDNCTKTGKLPSCACDDRLRIEATGIAEDPKTRPDIKTVASATAGAMALLICKIGPPTAAEPAGAPPSAVAQPDVRSAKP